SIARSDCKPVEKFHDNLTKAFDNNDLSTRRQFAQMPCDGQPGSDVTQQQRPQHQREAIFGGHASQAEIASVEPRQVDHRLVQPAQPVGQQQPGDQSRAQAIERAHVEEGPAHVAIGATDQLDHLDLGAPILDVQADGVADHQQQGGDQQQRQAEDEAVAQLENRRQSLDPEQIQLGLLDAGQFSQALAQRFQLGLVDLIGRDHDD